MSIEIKIGLFGAVAIVVSFLRAIFKTKFYNKWAAHSVIGYCLTDILSPLSCSTVANKG